MTHPRNPRVSLLQLRDSLESRYKKQLARITAAEEIAKELETAAVLGLRPSFNSVLYSCYSLVALKVLRPGWAMNTREPESQVERHARACLAAECLELKRNVPIACLAAFVNVPVEYAAERVDYIGVLVKYEAAAGWLATRESAS